MSSPRSKSPGRPRGRPPKASKSPAPDPTPAPVATTSLNRRPLQTRSNTLAIKTAQLLTRWNVAPNHISILSIVFALLAAASFWYSASATPCCRAWWLVVGVPVGVLGRLLCNMLDGMVAVEGGKRSKSGELYNDVPDRISDALIFVGFGYALVGYEHAVTLGWLAALAAVLTAYIRILGASLRAHHHFEGPFAKQHRMFFTWTSAILAAGELHVRGTMDVLYYTLIAIVAGSFVTCARRLISIQAEVEALPWPDAKN